jgi:hypothetical protein
MLVKLTTGNNGDARAKLLTSSLSYESVNLLVQ